MLWLIALPFVLAEGFNNDLVSTILEVVPATLLVSWLLLGIDDIGMQIEQVRLRSFFMYPKWRSPILE
jgi:hypothetical protein